MTATHADFIAALMAYPGQDSGDLAALDHLLIQATALPADRSLDRAIFGIFERFPAEDGHGVYWSIVHGLEGRGGYEEALVESVRRKPTSFAAIMLGRMLNAGLHTCAGVPVSELLAEVAAAPAADAEARELATSFLGDGEA